MNIRIYATLSCMLLALAGQRPSTARAADNWSQWHGPQANGAAADGIYPVEFNADKNIAWKIALPGLGMSTPAVWDDRIYVTCGIDGKDAVVAYDFTGEEKWRRLFGAEVPGHRQTSSGSNPSPVTDGKHLILYYGSGRLVCLDLEGKPLWEKNLQELYGKNTLWWDVGNSPLIAGDRVVVAVMQGPRRGGDGSTRGDSYIASFELATGDLAWKTPREYQRPPESDNAYTTPMDLTVDGHKQIVIFGADHLTGYDPTSGKLLWDLDGFNPKEGVNFRSIACPVTSDSTMFIPYGRTEFLAGVRLGAKPEKIWEREKKDFGADVPTPVARDGKGYLLTDKGRVECLDIATGAEIWSGSLPRNRNNYFASPVLAGNLLYCARQDGMVYVVDVSDGFKQVAENDMGEQIIASPVPVRGGLLLRGNEHLFWIRGEEPKQSQTAG